MMSGKIAGSALALSLAFCFLLSAPVVRAVPYSGEMTYTYHQPDGSAFPVKLYGDEFFAYQRTLDGREVILDPNTGFWCYARLAAGGRAFVSTGIPVVTSAPGSEAANRSRAAVAGAAAANQTLPHDVVLARVRAAQSAAGVNEKGIPLAPDDSAPDSLSDQPYPSPPSRTTLGTFVGLCILIDFPDQPGTMSQTQVDNFCNQPAGYMDFGNACSVNEYYRIQSGGKFNFVNTVTAYVRMPKNKSYYDNGVKTGTTAKELVFTALDRLIEQGFDFTPLSRDSSGYIYSINVFYAGTCSSGWSLGLWPHSGSISSKYVDSVHGIRAKHYQMSDMRSSLEIGTFCHENGHMTCAYPDLYSYTTGGYIVGYFSLMGGGCWSGSGYHPSNIDPYLKMKAGWADVVEINSSSNLRATAQEDRNTFYKYTNPADSHEYFMIENRNNAGYEGPYGGHHFSVNPGRGLALWHVYEDGDNTSASLQDTPRNYSTPYEEFIIEASPTSSYTPWYSAPSPSPGSADTFYSGHGADPLNDLTLPELKFWDHATKTGRTVSSGMVIRDYGIQGPALTFSIGSGSPPATPAMGITAYQIGAACDLGQNPASQVFNVFNAAGGTLDFTVADDADWLSCSPVSGSATLDATPITVSINASGLSAGIHTASITVTAPGASNSPQVIPVTFTVAQPPALAVSTTAISESLWPGQKSNAKYFNISNTGGGTMNYAVAESASWLTPSATAGCCSLETDRVSLAMDATGMAPGSIATTTIRVGAAGSTVSTQTINVTLNVKNGVMLTAPKGGESWPVNTTQTIAWETNAGGDVRIELLKGGSLSRVITASTPNNGSFNWLLPADLVQASDYRIRITTTDELYSSQSGADFSIVVPIYWADMRANPGWALQGQWAWGQPAGGGNLDPKAGFSGANILGYNLNGDYANSLSSTQWATTPAFNCSDYTTVTLCFYRWLGVEGSSDHAYIDVSNNNGATWSRIWQNGSIAIDEGAWSYCVYDLSAWAAHQAAVQVRWGLGPTNSSTVYCGWNIDDVLVKGIIYVAPSFTVNFATDGTAGSSLTGNPSQNIIQGHDCTAVTANAPANYHFVKWTKGAADYSFANPLTVTGVTETMTLTAHFAIDIHTLTYLAGNNGTTSGTTPQTVAHGGDGSPVTAIPNPGYHFVQWSDGVPTARRTDRGVTASITVTSSFAINTYTLKYSAGAHGSIVGTAQQNVNHGASGTAVTAKPATGYRFVQWSDGKTANPRTDTGVTANITVTAQFTPQTAAGQWHRYE